MIDVINKSMQIWKQILRMLLKTLAKMAGLERFLITLKRLSCLIKSKKLMQLWTHYTHISLDGLSLFCLEKIGRIQLPFLLDLVLREILISILRLIILSLKAHLHKICMANWKIFLTLQRLIQRSSLMSLKLDVLIQVSATKQQSIPKQLLIQCGKLKHPLDLLFLSNRNKNFMADYQLSSLALLWI